MEGFPREPQNKHCCNAPRIINSSDKEGRREERGGMVGLRDETDLLGCTAHYTCSREARVHCTDREYRVMLVVWQLIMLT